MSYYKNLDKIPENLQKVIPQYLDRLLSAMDQDVKSVFLYGSAAGNDYNPRTSDVNVGIVLDEVPVKKLKKAAGIVKKGLKSRIAVPLFLTESYIKASLDTFPIEFIEMKDLSILICGDDILGNISIEREDLRRECEQQIKGKLLTIKQAYLEQALTRRGLETLIKKVFSSLMPVLRNVIRLKDPGTPPVDKEEILARVGGEFGIDSEPFLQILRDKKADGRISGKCPEIFLEDFIHALERLSDVIDGTSQA